MKPWLKLGAHNMEYSASTRPCAVAEMRNLCMQHALVSSIWIFSMLTVRQGGQYRYNGGDDSTRTSYNLKSALRYIPIMVLGERDYTALLCLLQF